MADTGKTIRLFTALSISSELRAQLTALPRKGLDAKWTHCDDYHITLRFLGDLDESRLPEIQEALSRVRRSSFTIEAGGLAVFDNKKQAILHAKILSTRKMETLCADVGDALTPLGFDFGARPFVPHVTLARVRGMRGVDDYIFRHGRTVAARWEAHSFYLMRSASPDEEGRHYSIIQAIDFK